MPGKYFLFVSLLGKLSIRLFLFICLFLSDIFGEITSKTTVPGIFCRTFFLTQN